MLGVHGMSIRGGFSTPNLLEAETDRELIAAAQRLVVLADHTKWGTVGLSTIAKLEEADVLISDTGLPDEAREALADRAGALILAEPDENDTENEVAGQ
jgi:DeoR/GlpR family transcriptional regulator of sugar metabolism